MFPDRLTGLFGQLNEKHNLFGRLKTHSTFDTNSIILQAVSAVQKVSQDLRVSQQLRVKN